MMSNRHIPLKIDEIYTYKSPFEIEQMPEWNELKSYPHLCVSQTLVEGLKEYYGRSAFQVLTTIDAVLKKFYQEWHDSTENNIMQTVQVENLINKWQENDKANSILLRTIKHNKQEFMKALRMLIESDILHAEEQTVQLSEEQKFLVKAYKTLEKTKAFSYLKNAKKKKDLNEAYTEVVRDEIRKYLKHHAVKKESLSDEQLVKYLNLEKRKVSEQIREIDHKIVGVLQNQEKVDQLRLSKERSRKKYDTMLHIGNVFERYRDNHMADLSTTKVVIHGVHQFTPLILKFIHALNQMQVKVVVMFNYMQEYPEIYHTWKRVYHWSGCEFKERGSGYEEPRKIGKVLGKIYEQDFSGINSFKKEEYYKFDHLTSFSDYVGNKYQDAVKEYNKIIRNKPDIEKSIPNEKLMKIAMMKEQFYAINGSEINELLKVYFPEQFSSRHFLTYPVGQFILNLYKMWDDEEETIDIKIDYIKEVLSLEIWRREGMPTPIDMFHNLSYYFQRERTFEGYCNRLEKLKKVALYAKDQRISRMSFYIYKAEELDYFKIVLQEIIKIAKSIFETKKDNLKDNFQKLLDGIEAMVTNPAIEEKVSEEEAQMLRLIQSRLEEIEGSEETSYISTIKGTIGYYIQASTSKEYEAEWIVRDFEQIDGGILLAAAQNRNTVQNDKKEVFHYAGVSDENLVGGTKKELPWPLTTKMYESFNSNIASICATSRVEYNYFLRYSLFYGTYFLTNNKQIRLSYIKELGDDTANPYSIFSSIMNIKPQDYVPDELEEIWNEPLFYELEEDIIVEKPSEGSEARSMETCYMRYLWNHCLDQDTYYYDAFQLERIGKFFVEYSYLDKMQKNKTWKVFDQKIFESYMTYLPIFDDLDAREIQVRILEKMKLESNHKDRYIDNVMEFTYRKWTDYTEGIDTITDRFSDWIKENKPIKYRGICDNCNQRTICHVSNQNDEDNENE